MDATITFRGYALDVGTRTLVGPAGPVALRPKTFALLEVLARNPRLAMTKEDLLARVWPEVTVTDETLTQTVHELRKALGEDGPALIRTVPRRGYVFEGDPVTAAIDGVTLAVAPFVNQSGDGDQQYFAEGLTVDLEAALDLIAEIKVLPVRDGVATARYLLSGGVRTAGDQIRVNARLTDTRIDQVLWNGRFDGAQSEVFSFQDSITREVAVALQVELTHGDFARLWDGQTSSLVAWERMIRARNHYLNWGEADIRKARELAAAAIAADPDYGAARLLLGLTWWYDARFFGWIDRDLALDRVGAEAAEIIRRNPDGAWGWNLLSYEMWMRDRFDEAVDHARRASALAPDDAWTRGHLGVVLVFSGEAAASLGEFKSAIDLAPMRFDWLWFHHAHAQLWAGDLAAALEGAKAYRALAPSDSWGLFLIGLIHAIAGRREAARASVAQIAASGRPIRIADVRRSQRHRDPARVERIVAAMRTAGMPD